VSDSHQVKDAADLLASVIGLRFEVPELSLEGLNGRNCLPPVQENFVNQLRKLDNSQR